jgi:hypothetical protein
LIITSRTGTEIGGQTGDVLARKLKATFKPAGWSVEATVFSVCGSFISHSFFGVNNKNAFLLFIFNHLTDIA